MNSNEEIKNWKMSTDFLIAETEYVDWVFRGKNKEHKCLQGWHDSGNGRWFCQHLINSRKRNKKLKKEWIQNLLDSPALQHSEMLCKFMDALYLRSSYS